LGDSPSELSLKEDGELGLSLWSTRLFRELMSLLSRLPTLSSSKLMLLLLAHEYSDDFRLESRLWAAEDLMKGKGS